MGFWKKFGKIASIAAPIIAAPFTGGLSLLAIGAGAGAAGGLLNGGGWKGALMGAGLGAIPGMGGAGGVAKGALAPTLKAGLTQLGKSALTGAGTNFGIGAASGALSGGGVKGALKSGAQGALSGIGQTPGVSGGIKTGLATAAKNAAKTLGPQAGMSLAAHYLGGPGAAGQANPANASTYSEFLGRDGSAGGGTSLSRFLPQPASGVGGNSFAPGEPNMAGTTGGSNPWLGLAQQGMNLFANRGTGGGTGGTGVAMNAASTGGGGTSGATPSTTGQPGFWGKYGPLIAQGGGMVAGAIAGQQATKNAAKRSPEEQRAVAGGQKAADSAAGLGTSVAQQGQANMAGPASYYQTLLNGNRAAMSQAVAPAAGQIAENYTGASRALEHSGLRGAARDNATAELNRARVGQIAGLTTGVQAGAASQLGQLGYQQLGLAPGLMSTAGQLYGNQVTQGYDNRKYSRGEGEKTASAIGGLARDVGEVVFKGGKPATDPLAQQKGVFQETDNPRPGGQGGAGVPTTAPAPAQTAPGTPQPPAGTTYPGGPGTGVPGRTPPFMPPQRLTSRYGVRPGASPTYSFGGGYGDYAAPPNRWGY